MEIISEIKNPLFDRTEVIINIESQAVPSYEEVFESLSKQFKVEKDAIKIKSVKGKFGSRTFEVIANVYPSLEEKNKIETKTKQEIEAEKKAEEERKKAEAEEKAAKEAEEAAAKEEAEKPAEESSEEDAKKESKE